MCFTHRTQQIAAMTHDILPSDIDLAKKGIEARYPDSEIVAALVRRGIQSAQAIRLVDELRTVKPVTGIRPTGEAKPTALPKSQTSAFSPRRGRPVPTATDGNETYIAVCYIVASLLCFGAIAGPMVRSNYRYHAQTGGLLDQLDKAANEVVRVVSPDPRKALPLNISRPGAEPGPDESRQMCDYRSLLSHVTMRRLSASEGGRLNTITTKLDGFRLRDLSELETLRQEPIGSK